MSQASVLNMSLIGDRDDCGHQSAPYFWEIKEKYTSLDFEMDPEGPFYYRK